MIKKLTLFLILIFTINGYSQKKIEFKEKSTYNHLKELTILSETNIPLFFKKIDSISKYIPNQDKQLFDIESNYLKGCAYRNIRDFEKLTYHFEKTKELAIKYGYRQYLAEVHREMGDEYIDSDDYKKAIENYEEASKIYKEFNNEEGVIKCIYEGFIENLQGKYQESNRKLKKLLPTFKKINPIYLDALSTIAQNYMELKNIDSAFVYVNKMPLDSVFDINNYNYQNHKDFVYVRYYIEKGNSKKASYYNQKINKLRNLVEEEETSIYYFQNEIDIAILSKNKAKEKNYRDSLSIAYEARLKTLEKSKVYNTEKFIALEKDVKTKESSFFKTKLFLISTIVLFLFTIILGYRFNHKKKQEQEKVISNMQLELQKMIVDLEKSNTTKTENTTTDTRILELTKKHELTDRESDILFHIIKGYNNKQIADELFISINTVKYHTKNLYEKLDVKKRAEITSKILFDK